MRLLKSEGVQGSVEGFYAEEETKLRAIFASSPDAITGSDLNGNITDCNQATLDMGGFSSKEAYVNNMLGILQGGKAIIKPFSIGVATIRGSFAEGSTYTVKLSNIFNVAISFTVTI